MTDRSGTSSVISVGRLYCDLIFSGIPRMPSFGTEIYASGFAVHAGGGACITAAHLARLGRSSQLAAFLPSGPFGPTVRGEIRSAGVDLRLCQPAGADWPLQVTAALVGAEDRAFVTNRSGPAAPRLSPEVLRASGARHVHVGELATLIEMPEILGAARAAGLSISLDCSWDESLLAGDISPLLGHVDVFLPNASEARRLGELGIAADAARLTVIKDGANGARATMDGTTVSARVERALT
ncbi:MAG: PfkB family carbohydrate kinase, partial [Pseudomonadota bacterium]